MIDIETDLPVRSKGRFRVGSQSANGPVVEDTVNEFAFVLADGVYSTAPDDTIASLTQLSYREKRLHDAQR